MRWKLRGGAPPRVTAANVRRALRVSFSPRTALLFSTRNGPHSIAATYFLRLENSLDRTISTPRAEAASTPVSSRARTVAMSPPDQ